MQLARAPHAHRIHDGSGRGSRDRPTYAHESGGQGGQDRRWRPSGPTAHPCVHSHSLTIAIHVGLDDLVEGLGGLIEDLRVPAAHG